MSEKRNYDEDLTIDPDALDVEWLRQPQLYFDYARQSAEAEDALKRAEQSMKVIRSELVLEASDPDSGVLGKGIKPTAPTVEAYYRNHPKHQAAKERFFKASFEAEMLRNAVFAFTQRKVALENMVRLHGSGYFSGPSEPRDIGDEYRTKVADRTHEADAGTRAAIRERLNKEPGQEPAPTSIRRSH